MLHFSHKCSVVHTTVYLKISGLYGNSQNKITTMHLVFLNECGNLAENLLNKHVTCLKPYFGSGGKICLNKYGFK